MTRHRTFLLTLGIVQLLAASVLFFFADGAAARMSRQEATLAAIAIREELESRGELAVPEDSTELLLQHSAIRLVVLDAIYEARRPTAVVIVVLAFFGLIILLAGLVPPRQRPDAPARTPAPGSENPA